MLIDSERLTTTVALIAALPAAIGVGIALASRPWRGWLADRERLVAWLSALVLLGVIWTMHADISSSSALRFVLVPALTLMHGWALAILGGALVLGVLTAAGVADPASYGANLLCMAVVPALFIGRLHEFVHRRLPHNYFIYFFVVVFLGSAIAWNLAGLVRVALLVASSGGPVQDYFSDEYLAVLLLMSFGEAFVNGMLIATAVVFRPHWVMSFDDREYLTRRP